MARLDPIFERLFKEQGRELVFDAGAAAVMRGPAGEVPVLRQQLTAQQIAGVFAELVPEHIRPNFPAPGLTHFDYASPAGKVEISFERIDGRVKAVVRRGEEAGEEDAPKLELASAAEILQEYMHGSSSAPSAPAPTPTATGSTSAVRRIQKPGQPSAPGPRRPLPRPPPRCLPRSRPGRLPPRVPPPTPGRPWNSC